MACFSTLLWSITKAIPICNLCHRFFLSSPTTSSFIMCLHDVSLILFGGIGLFLFPTHLASWRPFQTKTWIYGSMHQHRGELASMWLVTGPGGSWRQAGHLTSETLDGL